MNDLEFFSGRVVAFGNLTVCPIVFIPATIPGPTQYSSNGALRRLRYEPVTDCIHVSIQKTLTVRHLNWTLATMLKPFLKNSLEIPTRFAVVQKAVLGFF